MINYSHSNRLSTGSAFVFAIVLIFTLLLLVVFLFSQRKNSYSNSVQNTTVGESANSLTPARDKVTSEYALPYAQSMYYGYYEDYDSVIFLDFTGDKSNPDTILGRVYFPHENSDTKGWESEYIDNVKLSELEKTKKINLNIDPGINRLVHYKFLDDNSGAVIIRLFEDLTGDEVLFADFTNSTLTSIYKHVAAESDFEKKGPFFIISILENKYVWLKVASCYSCSVNETSGAALLNIDTGNIKYLGDVGDLHIDPLQGKVMYKRLETVNTECNTGQFCEKGGISKTYVPRGPILSSDLP